MFELVHPGTGQALLGSKIVPMENDARPLVIGLVNNMPDAALKSVERQFGEVLAAAAGERAVCLKLFRLSGVPRSPEAEAAMAGRYCDACTLPEAGLDGLIVTGMEPRGRDLRQEPYWEYLTRVVNWADGAGVPSIWSCLAAHAAVLYLDDIERDLLPRKLSGVFECRICGAHPMGEGLGDSFWVPHSRCNQVREADLRARGYRILSHSAAVGADMFVREGRSLFLFLQGHPEYDPGALGREFRRDVMRFLGREREDFPNVPASYFDAERLDAILEFQCMALRDRSPSVAPHLPDLGRGPAVCPWRPAALQIYANWLAAVARARVAANLPEVTPLVAEAV